MVSVTHHHAVKIPNSKPVRLNHEVLNTFALMCEWLYLLQALQLICPYLLNCGKKMDGHFKEIA